MNELLQSELWDSICPEVNSSAEFFEIVNDFGNPLEIIREAISNAIDWNSTFLKIEFNVEKIDGSRRLVINFQDDGSGMSKDVLVKAFWGLGNSESRKRKEQGDSKVIGEKGHGTKIYLRSEKVIVQTKSPHGCFESICDYPFKALSNQRLHQPKIKSINDIESIKETGTNIKIIGYNDNERSGFVQDIVRDYILWFTKIGSIEKIFNVNVNSNFVVHLKCIDKDDYETINFGHIFPEEDSNIDELFNKREFDAAEHYVKRFIYENERLKNHPEVVFDLIVSIEGDLVKRSYNPMIQQRSRKETGRYKVSDRYGFWVCKDYIPIVRVNDWISGFGTGSNSLTMVHGFVNCQELKLTANRGAISNTDPQIQAELKVRIQEIFDEIDSYLHKEGIYTLRGWQKEHKTLKQETAEYKRRIKSIKSRKYTDYKDRKLLQPQNEAEVFGLFMTLYANNPEKFLFEPLDYNTTRGIDLIARNKTDNKISESEYWYVELKFIFKKDFNHAFKHLRWILCWDIDKNISESSELIGVEESDIRYLKIEKDSEGKKLYFLDSRTRGGNRIEIIKLKDMMKEDFDLVFD